MTSELIESCEWLVVRNNATESTALAIEKLVRDALAEKFGAPEKSRLRDLSEWLVATETVCPGTARAIREAFKDSDSIKTQLTTAPILSLITGIVGCKIELHHIIRFRTVIRHQDFSHSRPHQDAVLWPDRPNHINCWLPLCDIDEELAPLLIVPGSSATAFPHAENQYGQMEVEAFDRMDIAPVKIKVRFGDLILFSPKVIHFSAPNLTDSVRWSLDFRFQISPNTPMDGNETL